MQPTREKQSSLQSWWYQISSPGRLNWSEEKLQRILQRCHNINTYIIYENQPCKFLMSEISQISKGSKTRSHKGPPSDNMAHKPRMVASGSSVAQHGPLAALNNWQLFLVIVTVTCSVEVLQDSSQLDMNDYKCIKETTRSNRLFETSNVFPTGWPWRHVLPLPSRVEGSKRWGHSSES